MAFSHAAANSATQCAMSLPSTIRRRRRGPSIMEIFNAHLSGQLLQRRSIDEDFRTLSLQVLGHSTVHKVDRPSSYGDVSYKPETAPWFQLISLHYSLPYHVFFRLRYRGPRAFSRRSVSLRPSWHATQSAQRKKAAGFYPTTLSELRNGESFSCPPAPPRRCARGSSAC
jgi:hypothetical protein